jgi:hypothetical protein
MQNSQFAENGGEPCRRNIHLGMQFGRRTIGAAPVARPSVQERLSWAETGSAEGSVAYSFTPEGAPQTHRVQTLSARFALSAT